MSSENDARIVKVTITTGSKKRVIRPDADAGTPQSVKVTLANGKTVQVNADGSFGMEDGQTIEVAADGEIRISGRKAPGAERGGYNVQLGNGNTQINSF